MQRHKNERKIQTDVVCNSAIHSDGAGDDDSPSTSRGQFEALAIASETKVESAITCAENGLVTLIASSRRQRRQYMYNSAADNVV